MDAKAAAEKRLSELEAVMARDESRDELRRRAEAAERENQRLVSSKQQYVYRCAVD